MSFLDFMYFSSFWLKSLFFDYIFLEKSIIFCGAEKPFSVIKFPNLFPGGIPLVFFQISNFWEKMKLLITLDYRLLETFKVIFGHYVFLMFLKLKSLSFYYIFLEKILSLWGADMPFPSKKIYPNCFRGGNHSKIT